MGSYDEITVNGEWCRCSEGHDLRGEALQTKDLGCTMGHWTLAEERRGECGQDGAGHLLTTPFSGTLSAYTFCRECPAFLQPDTWNVVSAWVEFEFEIDLDVGRLVAVWRISDASGAWIEREIAAGSIGPMPLARAVEECRARRARTR